MSAEIAVINSSLSILVIFRGLTWLITAVFAVFHLSITSVLMMKQKLKSADEFDALYARDWYCYLKRAGATSRIKKRLRRRLRHNKEWMKYEEG